MGVAPEVHRPEQVSAVRLQPVVGRAVEDVGAGPVGVGAAELLHRVLPAVVVALPRRLAGHALLAPALLPESLDEALALVVRVELEKGLPLLLGQDEIHLVQPALVRGGEVLLGLDGVRGRRQ